jgi:2-hydroxymuconate-semialdehyde hydrolase
MALTLGLIVFAFFLILTVAIISSYKSNDFSSSPQTSAAEESSVTSYMEFPWGKIWSYDSLAESPENTEPIIFIHSMGASIYSWRHQLPVFRAHQRVLALDLLGYGKSDKNIDADYGLDAQAERIMDFIRAKGITQCKLVGCSMGGAFALWLSFKYPEFFSKVAVIAPAASDKLVPFPAIDLSKLAPVARRIISKRFVKMAITKGTTNRTLWNEDVLNNYFEPFKNDPNTVICLLRSTHAIKDRRIYECLPQRKTPTLILWGARDLVVRRSDISKIQKQVPSTVLEIHPDGGHHLMEDQPEWVNQKISEFFGPTKV